MGAVLAINKRKILESAQKHLQRGALDRALEDYRTLLRADPSDTNVLLKVGDLCLKQGKREDAINAYLRVAQQFTRDGFDAKAVALYKQISRLDPKRSDVCTPLAELYARMGLVPDAIASLQTAADAAYRAGDKDRALELLRQMAALDPANTLNRMKVADLLAKERRLEEAASEYEAVAEELARRGEDEERIRVLERLLVVAPDRQSETLEVARARLAARQYEGARQLAEQLVASDSELLDALEIVAHALAGEGEEQRSREAFRELAERFRLRGDEGRARDLMQRFGGLEALAPDEPEAPAARDDGGLLELELEVGEEEFTFDEPVAGAPGAPSPLSPPEVSPAPRPAEPALQPALEPPSAPRAAAAPAEESLAETDPDQLLAEATVYLRYGKHERAVRALRAILARQPDHRAALEGLGEALAATGETAHAVTAWQRAAESAREAADGEVFERIRERLAAVDPEAARALAPSAAPQPMHEEAEEEIEIDLDLDLGAPFEPGPDSTLSTVPTRDTVALDRDNPAPLAVEDFDVGVVGGAGDEARETDAPLLGEAPEQDAPRRRVEAPETDAPLLLDARETDAPLPVEAPESGLALRVTEEPTATTPASVAADLEEAEFYFEQGLLDEARALYERVLATAPSHPQAMLRLGEIAVRSGTPVAEPLVASPSASPESLVEDDLAAEFDLEPEPASARMPEASPAREAERAPVVPLRPEPETVRARAPEALERSVPEPEPPAREPEPALAPALGGGDFDLAAELSDAIGSEEPVGRTLAGTEEEAFEQVFHAFKSGVERELDPHDHEARFDLGIAYKEMGLLDDAIEAFRAAMAAPERQLDCLYMMGLCALDLGRAGDAVSHLEQALSLPELPTEQRLPLRFDLGRAYAVAGDRARARAAFEEVAAAAPGFRDVEAELARLTSTAPDASPSDAPEAYESLDDLVAEGAGPAAAPRYESFEDLFGDEPEPEAEPDPEAAPAAAAEPEPAAPLEEAPVASEPSGREDDAPAAAPEAPAASEPATPRRRRKISFV